jgi:hypothetical protein
MKTLKIITLAMLMFFASNATNAQVSINVNLGTQPSWGPVGYSSVDYYYIPDIQAYYDVRATQFIFLSGGNWIRSSRLPIQYRNYDLNRGYKVVLNDYHGSRPYSQYKYHKQKYYKGYGKPQKSIGYRVNNNGNNRNDDNHEYNGNKDRDDKGHGNKGGGKGNNGKGKN